MSYFKCQSLFIVGLGNPGRRYKYTRHNLGFRVLDQFQKKNNFPKFGLSKEFQAEISKGKLHGREVILVKPQTFINNSGTAVKKLIAKHQVPTTNLWIVHDEIDLPLGKIKISKFRGSAGHKGVESIIKELNSKEFSRLRIGIQPEAGKPVNLDKFVLQRFTKREEKVIKETIKKASQILEKAFKDGNNKKNYY